MKPATRLLAAALTLLLAACSQSTPSPGIAEPLGLDAAASGLNPAGAMIEPPPIPAPPKLEARGYLLMDFDSGQVLVAANENEHLEPASLTKLMSAYAVFHALKDGRMKLEDTVRISSHARAQEGSRMFVEVGSLVSVADLIQGLIVQSGNDATVALAEHVAGSEPVFVDLMNQYAQQLGMTSTHFQNSPGMPSPEHYTTSRDIAVLAAALIRDYPEYYHWYSQREFTWNRITQPNRNGLLERDPSVDGLKTGHTESAGYCLVTSAKRDGMRLVSVVMGAPSIRARENASAALLNYGFAFYQTRRLYAQNTPVISLRVWKGAANDVALGVQRDIYATFGRGQEAALKAAVDVHEPLMAPLTPAATAGQLRIMLGDRQLGSYALYPLSEVPRSGLFGRMLDSVQLWVR